MQDLKRRKNTNFQLMLWSTKYAIATWQTSISDAGLASGIFIIGALSARIVTGHVIDVLGRKKLLLLGTLIYLAALPIYFVCNARVGFRALLRHYLECWRRLSSQSLCLPRPRGRFVILRS